MYKFCLIICDHVCEQYVQCVVVRFIGRGAPAYPLRREDELVPATARDWPAHRRIFSRSHETWDSDETVLSPKHSSISMDRTLSFCLLKIFCQVINQPIIIFAIDQYTFVKVIDECYDSAISILFFDSFVQKNFPKRKQIWISR